MCSCYCISNWIATQRSVASSGLAVGTAGRVIELCIVRSSKWLARDELKPARVTIGAREQLELRRKLS